MNISTRSPTARSYPTKASPKPDPPPPPLRARQVCEAMDMEIAPNNINNTRLKFKRLTEHGILAETEQGLFTQPQPQQ
ncbi:hypothetical protein [Streptomyces sp. NBC_01483]|uniref:hypothetical protein n=1 Tax=Streptomyces sp. NBC_01483 TaxID=2903883 RepID=UPI002E302177|nr:hypothetical protein [Streptomyces sp. NBC_01483]